MRLRIAAAASITGGGQSTHLPDRSVMCTNVSLKLAKMCATPKTISPSITCGPSDTCSSFCVLPLRGAIV